MVKTTLVERDIDEGERLLNALDEQGFPVDAAYWLFESDRGYWLLKIASPVVDSAGPIEAYARIQSAFADLRRSLKLQFTDVSVVSPTNPLVMSLKKASRKGSLLTGMRLIGASVDGSFVEDAYVYRP